MVQSEMPKALLQKDGSVIINGMDEANSIYNKGYYGTPGNGLLTCDLYDALYLLETEKILIYKGRKKMGVNDIYNIMPLFIPYSTLKYLVYRDIRKRGIVVKARNDFLDFNVLPRGGNPRKTPSKYWVKVYSERWTFSLEEVVNLTEIAKSAKKSLLIGVIDEEGDPTYYKVRMISISGKITSWDKSKEPINGWLVDDKVYVYDPTFIQQLQSNGYFGKVFDNYLVLSTMEAMFLISNNFLIVKNSKTNRKISNQYFKKIYKENSKNLYDRFEVYSDLRKRNLIVKTGFKYGTHFRCYINDPDKVHAKYLVHVIPSNYKTSWAEVSRAIRLSHGVKKEMLFAFVGKSGEIKYLNIERVKL